MIDSLKILLKKGRYPKEESKIKERGSDPSQNCAIIEWKPSNASSSLITFWDELKNLKMSYKTRNSHYTFTHEMKMIKYSRTIIKNRFRSITRFTYHFISERKLSNKDLQLSVKDP